MAEEPVVVPIDQAPTIQEYKARKAADEKQAIEAVKEPPPEKEEETEEEPKEEKAISAKEGEEKPKGKGGFQRKIDRLIKQVSAAQEETQAERKKREEVEAKLVGKEEPKTAKSDNGEPKREDFQSDAEYMRSAIKWGIADERRQSVEAEARADAEKHHKAVVSKYNEAAIEAKANHDDWEEVVGQDLEFPAAVGMAILRMPNGPEVAYHLGKNPEIAKELMGMDEEEARGAVWVISRELSGSEKKAAPKVEEEEEEKPKKPRPIKPVGSSGNNHSTVPMDKMDIMSFKAARASGRVQ